MTGFAHHPNTSKPRISSSYVVSPHMRNTIALPFYKTPLHISKKNDLRWLHYFHTEGAINNHYKGLYLYLLEHSAAQLSVSISDYRLHASIINRILVVY